MEDHLNSLSEEPCPHCYACLDDALGLGAPIDFDGASCYLMVCRACGGLCVHKGHLARLLLREDEERWLTQGAKDNLRQIRTQLKPHAQPKLEVKCPHCQQWLASPPKGNDAVADLPVWRVLAPDRHDGA
jgi:hypothetical protein